MYPNTVGGTPVQQLEYSIKKEQLLLFFFFISFINWLLLGQKELLIKEHNNYWIIELLYSKEHRKRLRKFECLTKGFKQWKGLKGTSG